MRLLTVSVSLAFLCALLSPAFAKSEKKSSSKDDADTVIADIIAAVNTAKLTDEEQAEQKKVRKARIEAMLTDLESKGQMPPGVKEKILEKVTSDKPMHEQVPGMDKQWKARFKCDEFVKTATGKVLTEHLSQQELKDLLKFLKSPTGQKIIKQAPDIAAETVELGAVQFIPPLMEMLKEMAAKNPMGGPFGPGFGPPGFPGFGPGGKPNEPNEQQKEMMNKIKDLLRQNQDQLHQQPQGKPADEI